MARNNGRWGRLRRVLNEDLSTSTVAYTAEPDRTPGDTPRYGAGANIENHPQVTDYIPRRFRIMGLVLAGGATLGLLAEVIAHHADLLSATLGVSAMEITDVFSNRLMDWTSAIALVVAAAYARIVFLLKRHRLDDLRGRYRVWRQATVLATILSANSVIGGHLLWGQAVGHLTKWHPLGSDTAWWLMPGIVICGWVMIRLILDAAECRTALLAFVFSAGSFTGAALIAVEWSLVESAVWTETLDRSLPLAGCLCALAGTLLTARYVVLDVQGLIEHDLDPVKPSAVVSASSSRGRAASADFSSTDEAKEVASAWVDGSEPEQEWSDDDRPLSKAERKRLRKQHGRYRAA